MEKITKENFISLMDEVRSSLKGNELRLGQQVFNIFADKYIIAEKTRGTDIDPFYQNKKIIPFMEYVLDEEAYTYFLNSNIYDALKRD